ncbi:hypothetical protein ES705_50889 [subsurface metagenome]
MSGMVSGHQTGPRWCADCAAGIVLCKFYTLACQFIEVRGFDLFLTVTAQVTIAQVVSKDEDDVGLNMFFLA